MNDRRSPAPKVQAEKASVLAEAVASELHSLAQPLTSLQFHLDLATMAGSDLESCQSELSGALDALSSVIGRVDFLRDIVRPFRTSSKFESMSLRVALVDAIDGQKEVFDHEGVAVVVRNDSSEGVVAAPMGFIPRLSFFLVSLLRVLTPNSVQFYISESEQLVMLNASSVLRTRQNASGLLQTLSVIRTYVEVLSGSFSYSDDLSSIQIVLPQGAGFSEGSRI
jgi:C4-dicarboxylate-specific signal transduction histidine kinase